MKIDEFMNTINEIENFYKPKEKMTDEQKKIWFDNLKTMEIKRLKYICNQIYKTSKFFPKLADIIEINTNIGYTNKQKLETNNLQKCKKCNNTGYIIYKKTINNGKDKTQNEYGAICECGRKQQYKGWEFSDERYKTNFYTPIAQEIGI